MNWIDTAKNFTPFIWVGISLLVLNGLLLPFMFKSERIDNGGWPLIQTINSGSNFFESIQEENNQRTHETENALDGTHSIESQLQHKKNHDSKDNRHSDHLALDHQAVEKKHTSQNVVSNGHKSHSGSPPEVAKDNDFVSDLTIHGDMESAKPNTDLRCYQLGPLETAEDQARLQTQVEIKGMFANIKYTTLNEDLGHWVFIPPKRSKPLARLLVEELKLAGFEDVILLEKNEPKYAISMGLFDDVKIANKRLLEIQSKGFDAKLESRHKSLDQVWLEVEVSRRRDLDADAWAALLDNYPDVQLNSVNCP